jgi:hypothetical protein
VNKHTKVAILIAPILLILGYAATDIYSEHQAAEKRIFIMQVENQSCDIKADKCVLKSNDFMISVNHLNDETIINSTFPLDTATLFVVQDGSEVAIDYPLGMNTSPYYWRAKTNLGERLANTGASQKLRIIANIKGGSYISEFTSTTL